MHRKNKKYWRKVDVTPIDYNGIFQNRKSFSEKRRSVCYDIMEVSLLLVIVIATTVASKCTVKFAYDIACYFGLEPR